MNKSEKLEHFDPNAPANTQAGIFGLPFDEAESEIVIYPVPWEVTVSYSAGTADGPEAIKEASYQVDLYDDYQPGAWEKGIFMLEPNTEFRTRSDRFRNIAKGIIDELSKAKQPPASLYQEVNNQCQWMVNTVKSETTALLNKNKKVILLGGDHSTPLGYIQALAEKHEHFGILQIDAHFDLRIAFEGFEYSHASVMYNALKTKQVGKLVQVGIRDFCEEEVLESKNERVSVWYDEKMKEAQFLGKTWDQICNDIVAQLPQKVYLSFDIDGLDPKLCPNTGTPVAGGLEYAQAIYLIKKVKESGRVFIGADLNEVAPGENSDWDANVAARLLFRLCHILF
jgi:agmatinase